MPKKIGQSTKLVHAARHSKEQGRMVNPPIYQTSTVVFPTLEDLIYSDKVYAGDSTFAKPYELRYGRYGTQTNFVLEKALAEMEGGDISFVTSSGAAAINSALLAFLNQGDHLLVVNNAYFPTRNFAAKYLSRFGIEASYYEPTIGSGIESLIKDNTRVIFMESPGSLTFEIQDVAAICQVAKKHNIITIVDNSWSSAIYFRPLEHGADISIISLTKYINGYSDIMAGSITLREKHFKTIHETLRYTACNATPFSCYMVQRGLRSTKARMECASRSAQEIAKWLEKRPEIIKIFYPALESDPNHQLWKRDFSGAASLFSIVLDHKYSDQALAQMLDNLRYFGLGYSWGGYESLIMPFNRTPGKLPSSWAYGSKSCLRLHIGLEDAEDLKNDLEEGFKRLKAHSQS